MSKLSKLLVFLQISCLTYLILYTDYRSGGFFFFFQILGLSLVLWSIIIMGIGRFNIQPEVKKNAILITKGPYKLIRNPMYSGLILFLIADIFRTLDILKTSVFVILIIVLLYKIMLEEKYLTKKFGDNYVAYKEASYRLFPYIY